MDSGAFIPDRSEKPSEKTSDMDRDPSPRSMLARVQKQFFQNRLNLRVGNRKALELLKNLAFRRLGY